RRPDAVARALDDVVGAPLIPDRAVLVHAPLVAGAAPVADEFFLRRLGIVPVAEKEHRVVAALAAPVDRDLAQFAARHFLARRVHDRDAVPRIGAPDRPGLHRPRRLAVADDVIDFRLAEHLVDRHAELLARPVDHRDADRFARAHQRAQRERVARLRLRHRFHHQLERGRKEEGIANAVALEQPVGPFGVELAAIAQHRHAEIPDRQQRIEQAAGPRPVGRRPEQVARPRKEIVRIDEPRQVADEHAVRVQRALGRAGGAAGVDDERRILRAGVGAGEMAARPAEQRLPVVDAGLARAAGADHVPQRGKAPTDGEQLRQRRRLDDRDARCGVIHAVFECVRPEQVAERQRDRAHLEDRHVGDRGLGTLRQDEGDALAALHAECGERVGEPVRLLLDVPEGVGRGGAGLVLPVQREARAVLRPAAAAGAREVEARRDLPAPAAVELVVAVVHGRKRFAFCRGRVYHRQLR
ncbi:MAG: hypothetical protein EPN19_11665, partial [Betaproteobacteria bacterium]